MDTKHLVEAIKDQTQRALWEVENAVKAIPGHMWGMEYCGMPVYRHVYHLLHSLDKWMVNPAGYSEPRLHQPGLDNLDTPLDRTLTRQEMEEYLELVKEKTTAYMDTLEELQLDQNPPGCKWSRFTLILAQHRHLHTHMGMLMGFVVAQTGLWPRVLGLENDIPVEPLSLYF